MVLETIITHKRHECLDIREKASQIKSQLKPSARSFAKALRPGPGRHLGASYILECKKASPSKGLIRPEFDLPAILKCYAPFASAVSVLTDSKFFRGDIEFLGQASEILEQPVLCKDFILEPAQIQWARHHGADAILLMLSVLDDETYRTCAAEAEKWQIDVLTEVHDEEECRRAINLNAKIIGINNRNLKDLSIDLNTTARLAPLIPVDRILISESGFHTHQDTLPFRGMVDGFLVGSSLMEQPDLKAAVKKLIFGQVKVCGLTREDDARAAETYGAVWGGMILHAKSPRTISLEQARNISEDIPLRWVGVFVDAPLEKITRAVEHCNLQAIQLHGQESQEQIDQLRLALPREIQIWRARSLDLDSELPNMAPTPPISRFLVDRMVSGKGGGTGQTLNWEKFKKGHPSWRNSEVILAGGLNPNNAASADRLGMWALDVSSGLESTPARKDHTKIEQFFKRLRGDQS